MRESSEERAVKFFERAHSQGRAFSIQSQDKLAVDWKVATKRKKEREKY